jgi:hypothetical protein
MKKSYYTKYAVQILNILLAINVVIMANILYNFVSRAVNRDFTTTNSRKIQIALVPKEFDSKTKNYLMIEGSNPDAYLRNVHGEFETHNSPIGLFVFVHLYDLAFWGILFLLGFYFRKFFKSVSEGKYFNSSNIKILKLISFIIMIAPIADFICKQMLFFLLDSLNFKNGTRVALGNDYGLIYALLIGYFLFAIAKIIEDGIKLKEENDLTV